MPTNQISQRVQLLTHQTALLPPPRNFSVHEIEEEAKGHEREGCPYWAVCIRGSEAVAHGREDRHEAAEACQKGGRKGKSVKGVIGMIHKAYTVQFCDEVREVESSRRYRRLFRCGGGRLNDGGVTGTVSRL
ncbi:MAG: hypothetical protein LQ351_006947 [Letrouitia transgressa]|nr:MAG: hypothetical protein LQ351_006947 [Letrouitia transgressa]